MEHHEKYVETSINSYIESCISHVTYRITLLRAVGSGDLHGVEPGAGIFMCEALNRVTQFPLKVLDHRLARIQYCHILKQTHFCLLYTHKHTKIHKHRLVFQFHWIAWHFECVSVSLSLTAVI